LRIAALDGGVKHPPRTNAETTTDAAKPHVRLIANTFVRLSLSGDPLVLALEISPR